jgi:hypothetical protein
MRIVKSTKAAKRRASKRRCNKDRYALLVANKICPRCKGTPAPGKSTCDDCIAYTVERQSTPEGIKDRKARQRRYGTRKRTEWRNAGLCEGCGGKLTGLRRRCRKCRARVVQCNRNARQQEVGGPLRPIRCGFCKEWGHNVRSCEKRERAEMQAVLLEIAGGRREAA